MAGSGCTIAGIGFEPRYDRSRGEDVLTEAQGSPRLPDEAPLSAEDQALLAENVDLDPDTRLRIVRLHRALERADHYQLLGVERAADRKALKRAYFELAARLHPDRYFRKNLGSFKGRMEAVFSRLTLAHDTLGNAQKRAEYDAYLDEQARARGIESMLEDALAEVRRAEARAEKEASEAEAQDAKEPATPSPPAGTPSPSRTSSVPRMPSVPPPSVDVAMAARRDALARRLLGGRRPSGPQTPVTPPGSNGTVAPARPSANEAMGALRRRYEERKNVARTAQADTYVTRGHEALAKGDAVSAANAFRVATSLKPNDPELEQLAKETQAKADEILAATYEKQASYEERSGQWPEAARSWGRVCRARPDDKRAHDRAANALVKAGGDLHEAGRLAQRACTLEPTNASFHVTLANVYLAAGLALNARRVLETAAQHAPQDDTIQAMLKRVAKPA
jgi:tetratricopeptide (TPR) repeat protein